MEFEVGQVWLTRDGRRARILATDLKRKHTYLIVVAVTNEDGTEIVLAHTPDGGYLVSLAPKEITVEVFTNILLDSDGEVWSQTFYTAAQAEDEQYRISKVLARAVPFVWKGEVG